MRALLWIFVISLILRIWFNLFSCQNNSVFACDAAEYLRHAQNMLLTFNNLLHNPTNSYPACIAVLLGHAHIDEIALVKQTFLPLRDMAISGPVFPAFILFCYKVFGQDPSSQSWAIPLIIQSILSASTCVLIAATGRACWGEGVGIITGLIAAFYPGFIINSGRLYSEKLCLFSALLDPLSS